MAILFCFVVQAVSYEYRSKPNNFLGPKTFEVFLFINGLFGTVLLGTAVGTFFTGSQFSVAKINLTNISNPVISSWETPWHGLEAALNLHNVALGLAVFFLARVLAILYFMNHINHPEIFARSRKHLLYNAIPFLVFFLTFVIWLFIREGFAVNPTTGDVFMQKHKYLLNLIQMPVVLVLFLGGVVLVLWGIAKSLAKPSPRDLVYRYCTVLTVLSLPDSGYNNTAYYPSTFNLQHSLTIFNSSSSKFTLTVMSFVSLLIPFVAAYIWYAWKSINVKKIDEEEMKNETHVY